MQTYTKNNERHDHFDSVHEWLALASVNAHKSRYYEQSSDFTGFTTGKQLTQRIQSNNAVSSVLSRAQDELQNNVELHTSIQPEMMLQHDEQGMFIDMTAYTSGDEYAMINCEIVEQPKKVVWLAVSFGALARAKDYQFANRGIAVMQGIRHMQAQNISVGIIGYSACRQHDCAPDSSYGYHSQSIVIKEPNAQINESLILNMLADCATLRTIGFAIRAHCTGDDHGATITMKKNLLNNTRFADEKLLILDADPSLNKFKTLECGKAYVKQQLDSTQAH